MTCEAEQQRSRSKAYMISADATRTASSGDDEEAKSAESATAMHSTISTWQFSLLDLPVELQRLVFYHYFGGYYDITLDYERLTMLRSRFHIRGGPPTAILLVSKHVNTEAASVRRPLFTGRLILNSVFILVPLRRQDRFQWLRDQTRILHFSDSSVHPERWSRYFDCFVHLKRLEIDFPKVIKLDDCVLEELLKGREDKTLVSSLDGFRMTLVEQLSVRKMDVVVRQRYCLMEDIQGWPGVVDVDIKLNEGGAEVTRRRHSPVDVTSNMKASGEIVQANGNTLDAGSMRSLWDWHQAMNSS